MAENVVGIRGQVVTQAQPPNEDVIRELEELLERARGGDVVGVCIAFLHSDEACQWTRAGLVSYKLLGYVEGMKAGMVKDLGDA